MKLFRTAISAALLASAPLALAAGVNVNTADEAELQKLQGIGPAKAAAIVEHRQEYGAYESKAELTQVDGIGEVTLESIRPEVTLQ